MIEQYYIITSNNKKNIIATKSYIDCYNFIRKNQDAKVRKVGFTATPRVIDKRKFLELFLKNTQDEAKFFDLCDIMISGNTNIIGFLKKFDLLNKFRKYKSISENSL